MVTVGVTRGSSQRPDLVDRERPRLSEREADLVEPGLAVAAVFQPPEPQSIVHRRVEGNLAEDQLRGPAKALRENHRRLESTEQGMRDLQMEPLRPREVDTHRPQIDAHGIEPGKYREEPAECACRVVFGVEVQMQVV